jgi:hypothetical protein
VLKLAGRDSDFNFFDDNMKPVYLGVYYRYTSDNKKHNYSFFKVLAGGFDEANLKESDFIIFECPSQKMKAYRILMSFIRSARF